MQEPGCCPRRVAEQKNALAGPMDVVIATPTRFLQHVAEGHVFFRDIRWLVGADGWRAGFVVFAVAEVLSAVEADRGVHT